MMSDNLTSLNEFQSKRWSGYDRYAVRRSIYLSDSDNNELINASSTFDSTSRFQFPNINPNLVNKQTQLSTLENKQKKRFSINFLTKRKRIDNQFKILHEVATTKFKNSYELTHTELGRGVSGAVFLVRRIVDGEYLAAKAYVKKSNSGKYSKTKFLNKIASEVVMLSQLHHENVIKTIDVVSHYDQIVTIMEFCPVNLFRLIKEKSLNLFDLQEYFSQLGAGVAYLHNECGIAHRDLKLENLGIGQDGQLKILDFGSAICLAPNSPSIPEHTCPVCPPPMITSCRSSSSSSDFLFKQNKRVPSIKVKGLCGSDPYIAPEIWETVANLRRGTGNCHCCRQCGYDPFKADIWSLGVIYVSMHSGKFPWGVAKPHDADFNLFKSNRVGRLSRFRVPNYSLKMLMGMLTLCPMERFDIDMVMSYNN
ncbi:kinase-like protein [Neoconidiobolus thromboides FSU 785]|nr:kinase-like protein [Neoconidiobolus thromboides FSU 785]